MPSPAVTVNGTLQTLLGVATPGTVTFTLEDAKGALPRVSGTSVLVPVTTTATANGSGFFSVVLFGNDVITPSGTFYMVTVKDSAGQILSSAPYSFTGSGGFDLSSATPLVSSTSSNLVSAPVLLSPTTSQTITGFPLNVTNLNSIRFADQFPGADWCAKVAAADADLGATPGEILVNQASTPGASSSMFTLSPGHRLRFTQGGIYVVSNTLNIPNGGGLYGLDAAVGETSLVNAGVTLQASASFPVNTPVIKISDASHTSVIGVNVDCNNVSGCVGIQYTSTNTPGSSYTEIGKLSITKFHIGIVAGDLSNIASTNNFQADLAWVHDIQLFGASGDTTAEGIRINSQNAFDQTTVERINAQLVANIVHIIKGPLQTLTLKHLNGGSPVGSKTAFLYDSTNLSSPNMEGCEVEGAWTHCLIDNSTAATRLGAVWIGNSFNQPGDVQLTGTKYITSIGNTGGNAATWTIDPATFVTSLCENKAQWSGILTNITGGVVAAGDGSAGAPSHSFTTALTSGMYNVSGTVAFATLGALRAFINAGGICLASNTTGYLLGTSQDTGIWRTGAGVVAFGTGASGDTTGNLQFNLISKYGGVSTVANGVPAEYGQNNQTGLQADAGTTLVYAVPSTGAGMYRASMYAVVTQAATTSSTLPSINVSFTDADTSVVKSISTSSNAGNTVGISGNSVGCFNAKASTNINVNTTGYASTGATAMQFAIHVRLEAL